jgi:Zn-dependent protease
MPPVVAPPIVARPPVVSRPALPAQEMTVPELRVYPPKKPGWLRRLLAPLAVLGAALGKYKTALLLGAKYILPLLKTSGSMLLMIWVYSFYFGWPFAVGFVLLILIHECGHLLAARKLGLRVSAPMFIPFVGALITLKEMPRDAWAEAQVGIGGPLLGSLGAAVCLALYYATGLPFFAGLASAGFMINLFNLIPIGFLDGGRVVTALSPWLWVGGLAITVVVAVQYQNPILWFVLILSLPRLFFLFRRKTDAEKRYFEVTPARRWIMGSLYFGLAGALAFGMWVTQAAVEAARNG